MSLMMAGEATSATSESTSSSSSASPIIHRLNIPTPLRISYSVFSALAAGAILGAAREGSNTALRFRAENAHRLPTSTKGWYLYHKSKNYVVMFEGIKSGAKMASKLAIWVTLFSGTEAILDRFCNPKKDFRSTVATGITTAMFWSRWYQLSKPATGRMLLLGVQVGLVYGFAQDALAHLNGRTTLSRLVPRVPEESDTS